MKRLIAGFGAGILFLGIHCSAQLPATKPAPPSKPEVSAPRANPTQAAHPLEPGDIEAFFDGIFSIQLERSDIAGATVLVAQGGRTLLQKGYGYADWQKKIPVDAVNTPFRLASISKLFTWVSVMQLVEQGRIDLDTDVNSYLDFQIRPAFGKPVTLRNLMTHTGGFEEAVRDFLFTDPNRKLSLGRFLKENQPNRLYPPGAVPAYSNYGVGLAGYIVERTSGQPFEQYVQQHVFAPLGMTHSSFDEPLPAGISASQGYYRTDKPPLGFEICVPAPAGGVSSSAADMGRFAQALLSGGALEGHRILKAETVRAMWTPQYRASAQLPAACMGFYQTWRNRLRFVGHAGDLSAFHSMFLIEPQQKLVLFFSYNSAGAAEKVRDEVIRQFADRYYPSSEEPGYLTLSAQDAREYAGSYMPTRRADSTKLALANLVLQGNVTVGNDGVLTIDVVKDVREHTAKFKLIGKDTWQQMDEQHRLFFVRDSQGRVVRAAIDFPGIQAERVRWWESRKVVLPLIVGSLLTLLAVVLASVLRFLRRLFSRKRAPSQPVPGTIRLTIGLQLAAWAWLAVIGVVGGVVVYVLLPDTFPTTRAFDKYWVIENVVAVLAVGLTIWAVISAIRACLQQVRVITKIKFSLVALSCCVLSFVAIHWNVIGSAHRY